MNKNVPHSLKIWFVLHFILDFLFGLPLLFFPTSFLHLLRWPNVDVFSARLVGAALIAIGGISFLKREEGIESYHTLLSLKILWASAALFGIFITIVQGFPMIGWFPFILFALFLIIWIYYKLKLN